MCTTRNRDRWQIPLKVEEDGIVYNKIGYAPCGKCPECLKRTNRDWAVRLTQELKDPKTRSCKFLLLTYRDENLKFDKGRAVVYKPHVQKFFKELKRQQTKYLLKMGLEYPPLKYFCVSEYGEEGYRPHYHSVVYNLHPHIEELLLSIRGDDPKSTDIWKHGMCNTKNQDENFHYVTNYLSKFVVPSNITEPEYQPFRIQTAGLGKWYLRLENQTRHLYGDGISIKYKKNDYEFAMPKYYKDRLYGKHPKLKEILNQAIIEDYQEKIWEEADKQKMTVEDYIIKKRKLADKQVKKAIADKKKKIKS